MQIEPSVSNHTIKRLNVKAISIELLHDLFMYKLV